ncbi:MAG: SusC/RagA family protein, partial [Muribaculaceae bacterium]|nr:SusC/RagA family protein [Muribaculaceae bacterium]
ISWNNTFSYKNWDLGFNLRASIGNYVYNNVLSTHNATNDLFGYGLTNLVKNGGTYMASTQYMSDYYLRNGSFLRCDNITLGYTWENLLKDRLRLRLFAAVQNPFIITRYKGLDPEVFDGIDNNVYPKATTYSLGLVATF